MSNTNNLKTIRTLEKVLTVLQSDLDAIGKGQGRVDWKEDWMAMHKRVEKLTDIINTLEYEYNVLIAVCE